MKKTKSRYKRYIVRVALDDGKTFDTRRSAMKWAKEKKRLDSTKKVAITKKILVTWTLYL